MTQITTYFTPGPAQLYPGVEQYLTQALQSHLPSVSHRSSRFKDIYRQVDRNLRLLFDLPDNYRVLFTASATEVWERLLLNCVGNSSVHLVNGAFSERFYEFASLLKKSSIKYEKPWGQGFELQDTLQTLAICESAEMIAFTHNETSTGVITPESLIHQVADTFSDKLITVDMVSSAPYPTLDFRKIDAAYFSVQKAFGLPAGLGVWLVNERCLKKAEALEASGKITGTYHRLCELWQQAEQWQTPATPNVLGIYLLAQVSEAMCQEGIGVLRRRIAQQADALYEAIESHPRLTPFVANRTHRSPTVIVAQTDGDAGAWVEALQAQGLHVGSGYAQFKARHLRIANFPAVDEAAVAKLIQALKSL
ncbi:aminotransferase class V-fold PLP-dependent enzyme [Eisenibacter elegans]|jgi:phosphoserine aminotransferase|uniref:aminotransferase class V-fold PLP-dependent enzyme n=1 Tax=Eisenibacter elegans TaxID=997 RepID=UPI000400B450|nr:aminotransferase class V-fold PLP-dependent enzyme [Eisenibacter elegans]